ncbi:PEP-CTERM sorting domain-containing protein [Oleiharenicola lentus]|uniref:PEP-CTERM sorting domain-containing protein n=1 Tax=Oleiharenicola lentus TaxID=2508720 RepID=UPI003F665706
MKQLLRLSVVSAILVFGCANAALAQLLAWDFTGESPSATSTADIIAAHLDTGASFNTLTRGSTASASTGANSFRTQGFQNNGISTANTDYFQWVISAANDYTLSLSSISARFAGTPAYAATPGVSMQFAYSTDGSTFSLIGSPFSVTTTPSTSPTIDLSSILALQNINAATSITLRFYASGQTTTGGWGFNSPSAGTHGLVLNGSTIAAIPEPSTYAAVLGTVALVGVSMRRRTLSKRDDKK